MGTRTQRIAENEHSFRVLNEGIRTIEERVGEPAEARFLCECARTNCTEVVVLPLEEYQAVRADSSCPVVRKGHELADVEDVVREGRDHAVVKKHQL